MSDTSQSSETIRAAVAQRTGAPHQSTLLLDPSMPVCAHPNCVWSVIPQRCGLLGIATQSSRMLDRTQRSTHQEMA